MQSGEYRRRRKVMAYFRNRTLEVKKRPARGAGLNGVFPKVQRILVLTPMPADGYAVVLTRVPIDPEVALVCSTSPGVLPS